MGGASLVGSLYVGRYAGKFGASDLITSETIFGLDLVVKLWMCMYFSHSQMKSCTLELAMDTTDML
jgi:hypothetical protein